MIFFYLFIYFVNDGLREDVGYKKELIIWLTHTEWTLRLSVVTFPLFWLFV